MNLDPRSFKGLSRFLAPSAGGPVADRAVSEKLITSEQLQECILEQDESGRPLDEILVSRGYLKEADVTRLRAPAVPAEAVQLRPGGERVALDRPHRAAGRWNADAEPHRHPAGGPGRAGFAGALAVIRTAGSRRDNWDR